MLVLGVLSGVFFLLGLLAVGFNFIDPWTHSTFVYILLHWILPITLFLMSAIFALIFLFQVFRRQRLYIDPNPVLGGFDEDDYGEDPFDPVSALPSGAGPDPDVLSFIEPSVQLNRERRMPNGNIIYPNGKIYVSMTGQTYKPEDMVFPINERIPGSATHMNDGSVYMPNGDIISVSGRITFGGANHLPRHNKVKIHRDGTLEFMSGTKVLTTGEIDTSGAFPDTILKDRLLTEPDTPTSFLQCRSIGTIYDNFFTEGEFFSLCDFYVKGPTVNEVNVLIPRYNSGRDKKIFLSGTLGVEDGWSESKEAKSMGRNLPTLREKFPVIMELLPTNENWSLIIPLTVAGQKDKAKGGYQRHAILLIIERLNNTILAQLLDSNANTIARNAKNQIKNIVTRKFQEKELRVIFENKLCGIQANNGLCGFYRMITIYNYLEEGADLRKIGRIICPEYQTGYAERFQYIPSYNAFNVTDMKFMSPRDGSYRYILGARHVRALRQAQYSFR